MRRVLVTGGAGFIGSALVRLLVERGDAVRVYDDLSTGKGEYLDGTGAELVRGDVRDRDGLAKVADGCEVVFHLAAGTGVIPSVENPFLDFDLNAGGTLVRFSNAYGPRSAHKGNVIPLFIRRLLAGEELVVYGDGRQTRDFVFVTDLADGLVRAAEAERVGGEIFQLASGMETSIEELVRLVGEIAGRSPALRREPARPGEILRNYSLIDKARERLGYAPAVPLREGLRRTYDWFAGG